MADTYDQWPDPEVTDRVTEEMYGFVNPRTGDYDHEGFMERLREVDIYPDGLTEHNISVQAMQLAAEIKDEARRK